MKQLLKILEIVLLLVFILGLLSCSPQLVTTEITQEQSTTVTKAVETPTTVTETTVVETSIVEETTTEPEQEPVKIYEDDKVIIYFDSLSSDGVVFTVENLTDVNITIQADSISVNKVSINDIMMSDDIAPQSIGKVTARCRVDYKTPVSTIGGQLRIIDFSESLFDSYDASFVNVTID